LTVYCFVKQSDLSTVKTLTGFLQFPEGGLMRHILITFICLSCLGISAMTVHEAVTSKDTVALNQLLKENPSLIDAQDANGNTPLLLAMTDTNPELALALLNYKPRLDLRNNNGVLPIHRAAQKHSLQLVQRLVSSGADINATDTRTGGNVLHWAAEGGNLEVINYLITQGFNPNQDSNDQWKPVDKAVAGGHLDALKLLLEKGATFPILNNPDDYFFIVAINSGNTELVSYLIDKGFDPNFRTSPGDLAINQPVYRNNSAMLKLLIQKGAKINGVFDRYNFAPLHVAAFLGYSEPAQILLDNGAEIDIAKPDDGSSPLQFAIEMKKNDFAKFLISNGANLNFSDMSGVTPLNAAIIWDNNEMAYYLIERGVDYSGKECASAQNCKNTVNPPLINAAIRNAELIAYLLDKGVDINIQNRDGDTALIYSVYGDSLAPMQVLLQRKAKLNIQNNRGQTALILACQNMNLVKVNLLINTGCDISKQDKTGQNALHIAAIKGNPELVRLLISKGINLNAKDKDKFTPLDYAMRYAQTDVIEILRSYNAISRFRQAAQAQNRLDFSSGTAETGIWYLEHSGMAVRKGDNLFIFDYWKQPSDANNPSLYNGWINPEEIKDLNVYVFVSHSDMDHYDKRILDWQNQIPKLKYIFGFRPEVTTDYRQNNYALPGYVFVPKDSSCVVDGIQVRTLSSPIDDGSGFYVELNGLKFFHSGDAVNQSKTLPSSYSRSVDHLAAQIKGLDFAFLPMLGCGMNDVEALNTGTDYFIQKLNPTVIIPMHSGGSEYKYDAWRQAVKARSIKNKIEIFHNPGDHFSL
jgi:ankyrin repeat protein/L-ascorbate metabolism protein UlaG (beta-lactamase superfamily)